MSKPNPRRANGSRRTALRRMILATQDHCAICGQPVDVTLPPGLDASPEVDEIIPVSRGGDPLDPTNLQLTHRLCNRRKSNHMPGDGDAPQATDHTATVW